MARVSITAAVGSNVTGDTSTVILCERLTSPWHRQFGSLRVRTIYLIMCSVVRQALDIDL